jgi:hypothetical protein
MKASEIKVGDTIKLTRIGRKLGRTHEVLTVKSNEEKTIFWLTVPTAGYGYKLGEIVKVVVVLENIDSIELVKAAA